MTSVIIDDFNICRTAGGPGETDSVLRIDANTVLTLSISLQSLEAIAGREAKALQAIHLVQHVELETGLCPQLARKEVPSASRIHTIEQIFRSSITKGNDH